MAVGMCKLPAMLRPLVVGFVFCSSQLQSWYRRNLVGKTSKQTNKQTKTKLNKTKTR